MEINTIVLRSGYCESLSVSPLIFQLKNTCFYSKQEAWNSFLHFLVNKFKTDFEWTSSTSIHLFKSIISELFNSDVDSFGVLADEIESVACWDWFVNFSNITGTIEITNHAVEILTSEIYHWSRTEDPEFFSTLNPNNDWSLPAWLQKSFQEMM